MLDSLSGHDAADYILPSMTFAFEVLLKIACWPVTLQQVT